MRCLVTAQSAHDRIGSNKHHFICGQWSRTGHDMMVTLVVVISVNPYKEDQVLVEEVRLVAGRVV